MNKSPIFTPILVHGGQLRDELRSFYSELKTGVGSVGDDCDDEVFHFLLLSVLLFKYNDYSPSVI